MCQPEQPNGITGYDPQRRGGISLAYGDLEPARGTSQSQHAARRGVGVGPAYGETAAADNDRSAFGRSRDVRDEIAEAIDGQHLAFDHTGFDLPRLGRPPDDRRRVLGTDLLDGRAHRQRRRGRREEIAAVEGCRSTRRHRQTERARAGYAFRLCTSRKPTAEETTRIVASYEKQLAAMRLNPDAAARIVRATGEPSDVADRAAWTLVANALLNLDETITR